MPTNPSLCGVAVPKRAMGQDLAAVALGEQSKQIDSVYTSGQMRQVLEEGTASAVKGNDYGADPSRRGSAGISQGKEWRALVTQEHKLVVVFDGRSVGLFDRKSDTYEMKNLIDDATSKSLHAHLLRQLRAKAASVEDRFPEVTPTARPSYDC